MSYLFFSLQMGVPLFLRLYFRSVPLYRQLVSLFQDLFIITCLFFLPLSLAALLGFLLHLYLIADALLYKEMKLRFHLSYLSQLRNASSFFHSAKQMGLTRFFFLGALLLLVHIAVYSQTQELKLKGIYVGGAAMLAAISWFWNRGDLAYALNHPFLLKITPVRLRKGEPLPIEPYGPKRFTLKTEDNPHIVFLFLESFPAKVISRETTPHFSALREEGIYFSRFYSNGTLTYRALLSSLFGIPPGNTAIGLSPYVNAELRGIPEMLKKRGYKTAFHHNGSLHFDKQDQFIQRHFDEKADQKEMKNRFGSGSSWGIPDENLMDYAVEWLEKEKNPSFLTLFTITNHHPWIVPDHYSPPKTSRFHQTVHYTDYSLGRLIAQLKEKQLSQKTILFILGDHGQPMGEHQGNFYNSRFLYEENVHIPLLIWAEGRIEKSQVIEEIGSQIDLLPTICDLFDQPRWGLGHSLLRPRKKSVAFLQNPYSEGFIGCREGPWKWIENGLSQKQELYNLDQDPKESINLVGQHPELAEKLAGQTHSFFAYIDEQYQQIPKEGDSPYCLDLSHSLITDQELIQAIKPEMRWVNLENCLLLTDEGIAFLIAQCADLEELNVKGNGDLTEKMFPHPCPQMRKLDLTAALDGEKISSFCPYLEELSFSYKNTWKNPCFPRLTRLKLFNAQELSPESFLSLIQNHPHLSRLVVYSGSQITDQCLRALPENRFEMLWLIDAPLITKVGIAHLRGLAIRSLVVNEQTWEESLSPMSL